MANVKFHALLKQMADMHDKKSADYAADGNHYSNFEQAAVSAGCTVDTVFRVMIGIKLARLNELQGKGKTPKNESIQDSLLDLAVYSTIYASYYEKPQEVEVEEYPFSAGYQAVPFHPKRLEPIGEHDQD